MNLDETVHHTFDTLSDRLRAELRAAADEIAAVVRAELAQAIPAAAEPSPVEPAAPPRDDVGDAAMLDAVRSIATARSLSEVLDTLASGAARETGRAGILLVRDARLRGWRFVGFPPRFDAAGSIDLSWSAAGAIADAVRRKGPVSEGTAAPPFAELPGGRPYLAVPIVLSGAVVAVLYADEGAQNAPRPGWQSRVEILARFAARCLEAITAFNAARVLQERQAPGGPAAGAGAVVNGDAGDPADADAAARRYARLLVSEIKLYHEPEVIAGRRQRNLATRLSAEIARARLLYQQRVPPDVEQRTDYFRAELVRTLADGDDSLFEVRT